MSSPPFMPLWIGDFHRKTTYLDARETGAYMLLIMALWTCGGRLPSDQKKMQRVAKCGREWPKVWEAISQYFEDADGFITQARVTEELQKCAAKREVNAHNGARGGRAKALKSKEQDVANATNSLQRKPSISEPESEIEDSEANASDASVDFAKQIWDRGVAFLGRHGTPDKQARAVIGKWRKAYQDTDIFDAFAACSKQGVMDPIPWIAARLNGKGKQDGKSTKGERRIQSWLAGASIAPRVDCGPDTDASLPLLARR